MIKMFDIFKLQNNSCCVITGYAFGYPFHNYIHFIGITHTKYASWYDEFSNDIITISPFPVFHEKIKMLRPLVASTTSINPT